MNVNDRARALAMAAPRMSPAPLVLKPVKEPLHPDETGEAAGAYAEWFEVTDAAGEGLASFHEMADHDRGNAEGFIAAAEHAGILAASYLELRVAVERMLDSHTISQAAAAAVALEDVVLRHNQHSEDHSQQHSAEG